MTWVCSEHGEQIPDDTTAMLCQRNEELEAEKATLAEQLDRAETANARLRHAARQARIYAGDNLPAAAGLVLVTMLEDALKEGI